MNKMILILILIALGSVTLLAQTSTPPSNFATSTGLSGDPYFISSFDNLYWLSQTSTEWDKYFEQIADIDASATATLNVDGFGLYQGFSPIGNNGTQFSGSYNGNGYTIDGLTIARNISAPQDNIGLFGKIETCGGCDPASIRNLGVTNVNIQGATNVGGLVGQSTWNSIIKDCYSTGIITNSNQNIGGLVGLNYGSTITKCYSSVFVDCNGSKVGGLVGYNYFGSVIARSYSTGNVTADYAGGGLVGMNSGATYTRITDSYCTGDVQRGFGSGVNNIGAFCGVNELLIERCYSTGDVVYAGVTDPSDKGFVGNDLSGTYSDNFWDSGLSNQTTGTGATAKSSTQMKDVATFTATVTVGLDNPWDFVTDPNDDVGTNDYWDLDRTPAPAKIRSLGKVSDIDNGYPFLGWQNGGDIALPVKLTSFIVVANNQGVVCKWTTESEIENLGFILERKTEGTVWQEIVCYKTDVNLLGQGTISSYTDYEYIDKFVEPNITYEYRLADVGYNGVITYHSVRTVTVEQAPLPSVVEKFTVLPAYPNPFNPNTTISYGLDTDSRVTIQIYDITGKLINTLQDEIQTQGWHSVIWNGTNQFGEQSPAGLYLSRITFNNEVKTNKLMLLK